MTFDRSFDVIRDFVRHSILRQTDTAGTCALLPGVIPIVALVMGVLHVTCFVTSSMAQTQVTGSQVRILANVQTGTSYTVSPSDCGKLLSFSNTDAITVSLPQAGSSGLAAGCWLDVQNTGAGVLTVVPSVSTIDGAAVLQLTTTQGLRLVSSDGNYLTQRGSQNGTTLGNCVLSGANNDQLSCRTVSSSDSSQPGQVMLFDTTSSGTNYFAWAAPTSVALSYTAQLPASQPNGQVMQFSAPAEGTSISTGDWVSLGALATQSSVLPSQLPSPTNSTLGGVQSKDCSSVGMIQTINMDGTITCGASGGGGSSGGGSGVVNTAPWLPFGLPGVSTPKVPQSGAIITAVIPATSAQLMNKLVWYSGGNFAHAATWAVYSSAGALLASQSAGSSLCGGCPLAMALSNAYTTVPVSTGYILAFSTNDSTGADVYLAPGDFTLLSVVNAVGTAANTVNWTGSTASWPSTLGVITPGGQFPAVVLSGN